MGGGRSGLFPGTKGADPQQTALFLPPITTRKYRLPNDIEQIIGVASGSGYVQRKGVVLLTPAEVLNKCLQWRVGAVSENGFVSWVRKKLNDRRCQMVPDRLRSILRDFLDEQTFAKSGGKNYNKALVLGLIEQLEKKLETIS